MTGRDHEPLTPEERDLARRLARTGAPAEPSPALDARILAAARAVPGAAPVDIRKTPVPRRPRFAWATGLGIAASLLLAVGIAWQLRPLPDADVQYSPVAASTVEEPLAELRAPDAFPAPAPEPPAPPPPTQAKRASPTTAAAAAVEESRRARRQSAPARDAAQQAVMQAAEAPVVFDDPSPVDTPAPQAAPAPPPPAADAAASQPDLSTLPPAGAAAADAAPRESMNERERKASAEEASHDAALQRRAESLDRIEVTGSRIREDTSEDTDAGFDQPYDDEPPASADSPEVRKAWLSRIRELLDEGKVDAARSSLAEFHRRYPESPLPDDLRPLLE